MREYRDRLGRSPGTGGFYREIAQLVARGLVERVATATSTDPRRICYRATSRGHAAFHAWLGATGVAEGPPLAKAVFLPRLCHAERCRLFDAWRSRLEARVGQLEVALVAAASRGRSTPNEFDVLPAALERELALARAEIAFVRRLRRQLAARSRVSPARSLDRRPSAGMVAALVLPPPVDLAAGPRA